MIDFRSGGDLPPSCFCCGAAAAKSCPTLCDPIDGSPQAPHAVMGGVTRDWGMEAGAADVFACVGVCSYMCV